MHAFIFVLYRVQRSEKSKTPYTVYWQRSLATCNTVLQTVARVQEFRRIQAVQAPNSQLRKKTERKCESGANEIESKSNDNRQEEHHQSSTLVMACWRSVDIAKIGKLLWASADQTQDRTVENSQTKGKFYLNRRKHMPILCKLRHIGLGKFISLNFCCC